MSHRTTHHEVDGHVFTITRDPVDPAHAGRVLTTDGRDPKIPLGPFRDLGGAVYHVGVRLVPSPRLEAAMRGFSPADDPYADVVRQNAQKAFYLAMQSELKPQPTFAQHRQAHKLGIKLPEAPARLVPWVPNTASRQLQQNQPGSPEPITTHAVLCPAYEFPAPLALTLARAVALAAPEWRLYYPNDEAQGYPWFDRLDTVAHLEPDPDRMLLHVHLQERAAQAAPPLAFPTDVILPTGAWRVFGPDVLPDVRCSAHAGLTPDDAAFLMTAAYFDYTPKDEGDWETQHARLGDHALHLAARLLEDDASATRQVLSRILTREAVPYLPAGKALTFTLERDADDNVTVRAGEARP